MAVGKYSNTDSWIGNLGAKVGLPELGISELFRGDTRAMNLAKDNAYTRGGNVDLVGGNTLDVLGGIISPNQGSTGNTLYNMGPATPGYDYNVPMPVNSRRDSNLPAALGDTGGTGGTGAQANIDVIDGVAYNLNDPGQFQAYIQAANAKLDSAFDYFRTSAESTRDEDIAEAKAQEERVLQNISRAMENLSYSRDSYDKDYTRSLEDLAEGFRQGTARRQTFYASVAPRVYQSSQGTSQAYGENKYKEGQTRYAEDKERTYRDFNQAEQEYEQSQQDTSNQFELYKQRRKRQAQDAIFNQAQQTQGQRDAMMGKTKNWKADQVSAGRSQWSNVPEFQAKDLSGYTPSKVGLNDLMQFIKFQPAGVGATASASRSQVMATPEAGGQAHANYLGYQPEQEEEQPLNLYKAGKGSF